MCILISITVYSKKKKNNIQNHLNQVIRESSLLKKSNKEPVKNNKKEIN